MFLAREVVKIYYDEKAAHKAEENFTQTFQKHQLPTNMETAVVVSGELLSKVVLDKGLVESIGEFKRLIKEGAVTLNEDERLESFSMIIDRDLVVKIGKKRFLKIQIKK